MSENTVDLQAIAVQALKKQMLDAMGEDQKNELIATALQQILLTGKSKSKLNALDFRNDLMRDAIKPVLQEILRELINRQDNRRHLEEAAERAVSVFLKALPQLLEDKIMDAITEYVPEAPEEDEESPTGDRQAAE
jgi:proline dehydrogenase